MQSRALFVPVAVLNLLLACIFLLPACTPETGNTSTHIAEDKETTPAAEPSVLPADSQISRGLPAPAASRRLNFSLKDRMPLVYQLIQSDTALLAQIESYVRKVLLSEGLDSSESLEAVFAERDEDIIPALSPAFENASADFIDENWAKLEEELNPIGISMTSAEGQFTGLTQNEMLAEKVETLAAEPFRLYLDFINADAFTQSGEYPFNNMEPYGEMVSIGEEMNEKFPESPYTQKVEERFMEALRYFTDIHMVLPGSAMKQQGPAMVFVGGTNTDAYPWMTENASREAYTQNKSESRYADVLRRIMANPSEIGTESENIYVIVTAWAENQEQARRQVHENLTSGKDVPHALKIRRGDGTDQYAIAYRFYEDEEKADAAMEKVQEEFPDAQLIFCSVKGDKLYQLGI